MAHMKFSGYEVSRNPNSVTLIKKDKKTATVLTYSSVAYFSWGASIVGKEIDIEWEYLPTSEFNILDNLFVEDEYDYDGLLFDPQDGSGKTYIVQILSLDGKYFSNRIEATVHRQDVKMTVLILSEVV